MDAAGNYVVTWHGGGYFDKNSYLRAQRFAAGGGPLGINFDVAAHSSEAVALNSCDVAMDGDGDFAVIWATTWRDYRSEEHTSELQSLMRISYAVFCLKKKKKTDQNERK